MDKTSDLARLMRQKREEGEHPYVLILGAGASVSSGTSLNRSVVERVIGTYDLREFDAYLTQRSPSERFAILRDLVEGAFPSKEYQSLAELIQKGYFDVILSTNFDPLLEDAIMGLRMRRRDYVFLVHGVMEPELTAEQLDHRFPIVVTGGACGSPLVRNDGRIVGAIVAGREGSNQSYALTALRLREMLVSAGLGLAR